MIPGQISECVPQARVLDVIVGGFRWELRICFCLLLLVLVG